MIVIAAVDERGGMMFNNRRVSRDRVMIERILEICGRVWMNGYSEGLFGEENAVVDENFLEKAGEGEFCFVENVGVERYAEKIERVMLFKWNRKYPADFYFDIDLNLPEWEIVEMSEFAGSSHEKITMEVYRHV
ncbi:MAG: ribonuclease Z [Clostridia bacterium]|nr:ribonuclease Z [Clostridia bacterium]